MSIPPKPITATLELCEHEMRMVIHGLVCERDALLRTAAHCDGMPHFKTYTLGKVALYERLIEKVTLAK